jgi:transposase InsO family protein
VCKRRFVRATDSYHDWTVPPNLAAAMTPIGPIYLAVILDAWSRRVVGYALAPHMDVRGSHWRRWPARSRSASRRPDASATPMVQLDAVKMVKRYLASLK